MTQPEPLPMPVYLRVGDAEEYLIDAVHVTSADQAVPAVAKLLHDFAQGLLEAVAAGPDGPTPPPPAYEGEHGPEIIQRAPRGRLYDLSNEAARAAWPTPRPSPPPTPGG